MPAQAGSGPEQWRRRLGPEAHDRRRRQEVFLVESRWQRFWHRITHHGLRRVLQWFFPLAGWHETARRECLNPVVETVEHPLARLPPAFEGFRVLQLSDLHLDLDGGLLPAVLGAVERVQYDAVVLTGDYRAENMDHWGCAVEETARLLRALHCPLFGILGNHDELAMVPALEAAGMRMLLNEAVFLERGGQRLWLAGVDDAYDHDAHDFARARAGVPAGECVLLLCHAPHVAGEAARHDFDLMLSGHTHGGQICLPGGVPVLTRTRGRRHLARGLWREDGLRGYTSRGTGSATVAYRMHCPAEITVHVLRRADQDAASAASTAG